MAVNSPNIFSRKDGSALIMAGIWEESKTRPTMPLALADDQVDLWLDPKQDCLMLDLQGFVVRPMDPSHEHAGKDLEAIDRTAAQSAQAV